MSNFCSVVASRDVSYHLKMRLLHSLSQYIKSVLVCRQSLVSWLFQWDCFWVRWICMKELLRFFSFVLLLMQMSCPQLLVYLSVVSDTQIKRHYCHQMSFSRLLFFPQSLVFASVVCANQKR